MQICCCTVGRNCFPRPCPPQNMYAMQILASTARPPAAVVAAMHHTTAVAAAGILTRPLLLVSDLDDTLVQHTHNVPGTDAASAALKAIWERSRDAGVRCKLAINKGRYPYVPGEHVHTALISTVVVPTHLCAPAGPCPSLKLPGRANKRCCLNLTS